MKHHFRILCLALASFTWAGCSVMKKAADVLPGGEEKPAEETTATELPDKPLPPDEYLNAVMTVDIAGTKRRVVIQLEPGLAPKTVANFKKLANNGYYNGLAFHRCIRGYLVQGGDPRTKDDGDKVNWGTGGPDYTIPAEIKGKHKRGAIAMARLTNNNPSKSSSGSQFYIMLRTAKNLDADYTVFGHVTQGMDVLDQIGSQVVDTNDAPVKRVEIKSIDIVSPTARELEPQKTGRPKTVPDSQKGKVTRFIERVW